MSTVINEQQDALRKFERNEKRDGKLEALFRREEREGSKWMDGTLLER